MQTPVPIPDGFVQGVEYLDSSLAKGKPIVVGVYTGEARKLQSDAADAKEILLTAQENLDKLNEEIRISGETEYLLSQKKELEEKLKKHKKNMIN